MSEADKKNKKKVEPVLVSLSKNIHYISGFTNIGVITTSTKEAYFIDTGANEEFSVPAWHVFQKQFPDYKLKAVLITHAHSDHVGGDDSLIAETGCELWASRLDGFLLEMPVIMPALISNGLPVMETEIDYYYSKSKTGSSRELKDGEEIILGDKDFRIRIYSLPGHFFSQIGFLIEDLKNDKDSKYNTVLFAGDAIYGRSEVKRYWIPYNFNEEEFLKSLEVIKSINADLTVPSHGNLIPNEILEENIELNNIQALETEKMILSILKEKAYTFEEILKKVADINGLSLRVHQAYLIGSTLRGFLACLQHRGLIKEEVVENRLFWSIK